MKEKVIIYGIGKTSQFYMKEDFDSNKFEIIAISDGNAEKWGSKFLEMTIISPQKLCELEYDVIIIASAFVLEITKELIDKYKIEPSKIKNMYYRQQEEIIKRYNIYYDRINYNKKKSYKSIVKESDKIVIYTAITGKYDNLRTPKFIDKRCKYICFTDNLELKSDLWEIRYLDNTITDFNRKAKKVKILPHCCLNEFEWSIWVDGAFDIVGDLVSLIDFYALNSNCLSFLHYVRESVYKDAEVIIKEGFEKEEIIRRQIKKYREEGYEADNELIAGGVLFRRHNELDVVRLMNRWWSEIVEFSKRDQISFNYSAWKEKIPFDVIDMNIYNNDYVKWYPHNHKRG